MSLFDLSFAVAYVATATVTIKRYAATVYGSDGRAQARSSTSSTARGSVQPTTGQDLKRLPEGTNASDVRAVFVTASVLIGDELTINGERLQVFHVGDWNAVGNYTRVLALKLDARET